MRNQIGSLKGDLKSLQESDNEDDEDDNDQQYAIHPTKFSSKDFRVVKQSAGWFSMIKGLVGEKKLTSGDLIPLVEKMRDNLISKYHYLIIQKGKKCLFQ